MDRLKGTGSGCREPLRKRLLFLIHAMVQFLANAGLWGPRARELGRAWRATVLVDLCGTGTGSVRVYLYDEASCVRC